VINAVVEHSPDLEIMGDNHFATFAIVPRYRNPILITLREPVPDPGRDRPTDHEAVRFFTGPDNNMITQFEGD
jgi:hypothetical protein